MFVEFLPPKEALLLEKYVNEQLKLDLDRFENLYGYKGNVSLVKWLLIYNVYEKRTIAYKGGKDIYGLPEFIMYHSFFRYIERGMFEKEHMVCNHYYGGFITLFNALYCIGGDGIGNFFYTNFLEENSQIVYYDHESLLDSYYPLRMNELIERQAYPSLSKAIDWVLENKKEALGLDRLDYKADFKHNSHDFFEDLNYSYKEYLSNRNPLQKFMEFWKVKDKSSPFVDKELLSGLLKDKDSDYYNYGNVRAAYNPLIVASLYWSYIIGDYNRLQALLEETDFIVGDFYKNIRASFLNLCQGDTRLLKYTYQELLGLRDGLEISNSQLATFEKKLFASDIEALERKKNAIAQEKADHADDNYFLMGFGIPETWGLRPDNVKYSQEKPLSGLKPWEATEVISCYPSNHNRSSSDAFEMKDTYTWLYPVGTKNMVVSEKFKAVLEQYDLPAHRFYDLQVRSFGEVYPYYAFLPMIRVEDYDYIDFEKMIFFSAADASDQKKEKERKYANYAEYLDVLRSRTVSKLVMKNNIFYINKPLDVLFFRGRFLVSNRLKKELEKHAFTGISFYPLIKCGSLLPFSKIIVTNQ